MAITGGMDISYAFVSEVQKFIHSELRNVFPDITMSGLGVQENLCLNIGTEHALTDDEKKEICRRIAERFIQFIIVEKSVLFS